MISCCLTCVMPLQAPEALTRSTLVTAGECLSNMARAGLDEPSARAMVVNYPQLLFLPKEQLVPMLRTLTRFASGIDIREYE